MHMCIMIFSIKKKLKYMYWVAELWGDLQHTATYTAR